LGTAEPAPVSFRERLAIHWQGLLLLPRTYALIAWLLLRQRREHRDAIAELRRASATPPEGHDPLRALEPGLYEVEPAFLNGERAIDAAASLTVVHLLGTGETIYSPLTGLAELCAIEPRLRAARHVIADTPHDAAAFLGPGEFAARLRRTLAPELARNPERIVLVGLSRGGAAAFDLGGDLAATSDRRIAVLALAPPLTHPARKPASVLNIGGLEPVMENFTRLLAIERWLQPFGRFILRELYIRFSGFVLAELQMVSRASIAMFGRFVHGCDQERTCLRAVREFALLGRVGDIELRHAASSALQRMRDNPRAHAVVCWGSRDPWLELEPCRARLAQLIERHEVPRERVRIELMQGVGHGIGREPAQDFARLAALYWEACEHALTKRDTESST
jgi:hypothetical protein